MRVDQLKYDIRHLKAAFQSLQSKKQRQLQEINEREQLLNRKFDANPDTAINIDFSLQHNSALQNSNRGVDEMIYTGNIHPYAYMTLPLGLIRDYFGINYIYLNFRKFRAGITAFTKRNLKRCT